jgi:hypothetical protein
MFSYVRWQVSKFGKVREAPNGSNSTVKVTVIVGNAPSLERLELVKSKKLEE